MAPLLPNPQGKRQRADRVEAAAQAHTHHVHGNKPPIILSKAAGCHVVEVVADGGSLAFLDQAFGGAATKGGD